MTDPPDWTPEGAEDVAVVVRHILERSANQARELLEKLGVNTEVVLFALQVNYEGIGPMVVALTHPEDDHEPVANIAERVWQIYADEA